MILPALMLLFLQRLIDWGTQGRKSRGRGGGVTVPKGRIAPNILSTGHPLNKSQEIYKKRNVAINLDKSTLHKNPLLIWRPLTSSLGE